MTSTDTMRIIDPLPQRYLTDDPGIGGRIKVRAEDFLVDEIPLYEPSGEGEHLYLGIEKSNVSHGELVGCLRRHFHVPEHAIGFAGMKDKVGVTRQTVSVNLRGEPPAADIGHARIKILWKTRHNNKIKLGHLAGNRFSIRVRDVDPMKAPAALRTLRALERQGVPNYFGQQRFGYRRNNHLVGAAVVNEDWGLVLKHLLGTHGGSYPPYQRERRELFDAGKFAEAAALWTTADRSERIVCGKLAIGKTPRDACLAVGPTALDFWVSALQSAMFNRVLDQRLQSGRLAILEEGDLAWKHETRGVFRVTAAELAGPELARRLEAFEISPSGPIWGGGMLQAEGAAGEVEREALDAAGMSIRLFEQHRRMLEGARRPLRNPMRNASLDSGVDEHGPYIRAAFDLPRGAYATVVLREIMKNEESAASGDE